jgi:hypothetical protein
LLLFTFSSCGVGVVEGVIVATSDVSVATGSVDGGLVGVDDSVAGAVVASGVSVVTMAVADAPVGAMLAVQALVNRAIGIIKLYSAK